MRTAAGLLVPILVLLGMALQGADVAGEEPPVEAPSTGPAYRVAHRLEGHEGIVRAVAFRPGHAVLASGGSDRTLRLWNAQTGKALARQELPRGG